MQRSKQAKKRVNIDVIRYMIAEMQHCISIVVLTYCRKSILTYVIAVGMLYINSYVWNYRCNDMQKYRFYYLQKQIRKSMIDWWFTLLNHYFFTYLKIYINE